MTEDQLKRFVAGGRKAQVAADSALDAYKRGLIEGVTRFAWWKDGTQYVGSCGTTLKDAIAQIEKECQ